MKFARTHCPLLCSGLWQEMGLNVLSSFIFKLLVGFRSFQEREYNDKYHWRRESQVLELVVNRMSTLASSLNEKSVSIHGSNT